jgi:hypothetical protein
MTRYAIVKTKDRLNVIQAYLPSNYEAEYLNQIPDTILIHGFDVAGWTLTGYVIPRLASGLYFAKEV